ncbi:D-2-hydroxyacid dehydrogenase [Frigidibacter sp.]|uniref:D-2-hydroxyacid dehydrogenase n=1 Tax=Frigidibacter sp. TaxID=2586418 RepID=UPI002732CD5D|nr:D-2-hydroxyacid dehydrogenase [Frigidibacter sp.]MDP3342206.1 D-2-hydroxyacid dehydrogenase [Frigidibacter sp.]
MGGPILIFDTKADFYADKLREYYPDLDVVGTSDMAVALQHGRDARVLVGLAPALTPALVASAPQLDWVQALTTGVDNLLKPGVLPPHVTLTNCNGIHGPQMSELAFLLMLSLLRRFPEILANQAEGRWARWPQPLLSGKTLCIVGLGAIAEDLAHRARAFGMRVTAVSNGRTQAPGFARVYPRAELGLAATETDVLVVLVPYSASTHHIVDGAVLAAMKPAAVLVNIARGGCVDEAAVLAALTEGQIAGAALDVFATEPLPPESPLWSAPNCIVTPHIGGMSDSYHEQALPLLIRNIGMWREGGTVALPGHIAHGGDA